MSQKWYCKILGEEMGPLSLDELRDLVEQETIGREDSVRQDKGNLWMPARMVRGLFPEAISEDQDDSDSDLSQIDFEEPQRPAGGRGSFIHKPIVKWIWGLGLIAFVCGTFYTGWYTAGRMGFPEAQYRDVSTNPAKIFKPKRAPAPRTPTILSLKQGKPVPVPGLEKRPAAFSPSLTPDLKTIVFADVGNPGTGYDLYLAERKSINSPFETPQLILNCSSPKTDAYPAISEDGLEVVFIRGDLNCEIWHARRESTSAPFDPPVQWIPEGVELKGDGRFATPQFLDKNYLRFNLYSTTVEDQRVFLSKRTDPSATFGPPEIMPFVNHSAPYFVTKNGRRAYYGTHEGIYFTMRPESKPVFRAPEQLVDSSISGPVDGPVYVVPKEDVVIYCSPGPGEKPPNARSLWMLRY